MEGAEVATGVAASHPHPGLETSSDTRYRILVEGVSDYAIYLLDLDGRISSWNAGAERFKGYQEAEVLGRHFSIFYSEADRQQHKPARALAEAMTEGRFEGSGWRLRKDGSPFWAHVVIDLIRDNLGRPIGYAKITRDISERRAAELRMRDLTLSNQELEQFVSVASHDLREPLRKILAFSDLLGEEAGTKLSEQEMSYLHTIASATRRMQALLASLLNLTRVTSSGRSFDPLDLGPLLDEVCADLQLAVHESGAQIEVGALPKIEADATQMRQLFQNLIENSIKYARAGVAPRIEITQCPDADPDFVCIECRDNGIGFEPEYAERIFGVFQRLHTRDQYEGDGIGLSICRKICTRHGGKIHAVGKPMLGAVVTVRLPKRHRSDVV